jgi:uncharacterized protein YqeY
MLFEQLKKDRIAHFKKRNDDPVSKVAYNVLGVLISDSSKDVKEPDDTKVIGVIKKFIENAKFTLDKAEDQLSKYTAGKEIEVLEAYLPKQLTEPEIRAIIVDLKENSETESNKLLGFTMAHFKQLYSGQYDGGLVSRIAKELL